MSLILMNSIAVSLTVVRSSFVFYHHHSSKALPKGLSTLQNYRSLIKTQKIIKISSLMRITHIKQRV